MENELHAWQWMDNLYGRKLEDWMPGMNLLAVTSLAICFFQNDEFENEDHCLGWAHLIVK